MRYSKTIVVVLLLLLGAALPASAESGKAAPPSSAGAPATSSASPSPSGKPSTGTPTTSTSPAPSTSPGPTSTSPTPAEPQQQSASVMSTTSTQYDDPYGSVTFTAHMGVIQFNGYALDPNDLAAPVTAIFTVDGEIHAYALANQPSPQLYPYGVSAPHGLKGAFGVARDGTVSVCMFLINIGPGSHTTAQCSEVHLPSQSPVGGLSVGFDDRGDITISGYAFDPSSPTSSIGVWVVDNGQLKSARIAGDSHPSLMPYGVPGNHGVNLSYFAGTAGTHEICLYAINIGAGSNQWVDCKTVEVTHTGGYNNPRGDFSVVDNNGGLTVVGWAFDANDFYQPTTVMWTVDGQVVAYSIANLASEYLGLPGNHGTVAGLPAKAGKHSVCMFVGNIGPGASQLVKCSDVEVKSGWMLPVEGTYTSCYCPRWGTFHHGIDLANWSGTPMYAAADGVVVSAGPVSGYGNLIVIKHPESGIHTAYAHMYSYNVYVGQYVSAGQQIATVGAYGNVTGPHLHFETWWGPNLYQNRTDPAKWLSDQGVQLPPYRP